MKDNDSDIREEAVKALREITGKDFGEYPERWQQWWEQNKKTSLGNEEAAVIE